MNTRRYIRIIVVLLFLLTNGVAKMWAEVGTGDIKIMNTTGGNVTVNSVEAQSGDYKVTMTATPAGGYEILKKDFVVEPVTDPSLSRQRQAPGIAATLEVEDGTSANEFYFILPARYSGAIVTANFSTTAPIDINNLGDIKNPSGNYRFSSGFSASGTPADNIGSATNPFKGKIDGNFVEISLGNDPLFKTVDGAIIKNVIISSASTTTNGHAGAIACVAKGDTRIYNCGILSGTISGSGYVGGIVGFLDGNSRVINCYSYANIAAGGTDKGGIVGYNNYASKHNDIRTMVMNCMFYGTIATGGNVSPVYGGENIDNLKVSDTELGLNTYNYYRYESNKKNITSGKYNCALAAKEKYLVHFELYRQLLNSNRKLAAWYAVNDASKGVGENNEMAKWVLDRSIAPYPILKKQGYYSSVINYDPEKYYDASGTEVQRSTVTERNKGKILGELTVNISAGNHGSLKSGKSQIKLKRIDKDFDNYNYNYDKVQLPYYNEVGNGNYTDGMVVTGWKVTVSGGSNSYSSSGSDVTYDSNGKVTQTPYNFADRNCTGKDNYSTSTRVFSQGAYFDVPYGVDEISIEAYWGKAAYICDKYYDVVYTTEYNGAKTVGDMGVQGNNLLPGGQTIYTSITGNTGALASLTGITNPTVYDYALVLVGNLHLNSVPSNGDKPFTIMSADFDNDNEPDYSLIYTHPGRSNGAVSPIRFDFINVPGMAMAQKPNGATKFLNVSIFKPKGWFEVTNTCLITVTQFEYDNGGKASATTSAPVILLGGEYEQFVSTQSTNICADGYKDRTSYIHIGSNAWFKEFNNGTHSDGYYATKHIPVSVTGGYYEKFYLSGAYRPDAQVAEDDAEGYISGGKFDEVAGAGQQQIDGNVYWQIYDADITDFYGGGVNYDKPITGNITVDIFNSHVTTYCGGPKFGDMQKKGTVTIKQAGDPSSREKNIDKDRTVTTNATGCVFGDYFGAGYGGISFVRRRTQDATAYDFSTWVSQYTNNKGKYFDGTTTRIGDTSKGEKAGPGVAVDFDYEFFVWSTGETGGRFYIKYASLSFAKTNDVNSTLNDCHITHNFYGGGHLGKVDGNVTSALNGCTIDGEVFGAGYSANRPTVPYRNGGFTVDGVPDIDTNAGVFADGEKVAITDDDYLTLEPGKTLTNNKNALGSGTMYTNYTEAQLNSLGTVAGKVTLTIDNYAINSTTTKETTITGNVYGGGESSDVYGVNSSSVVTSEVEINVKGGSMADVYGGGKGQTTIVGGDVTVNIGKQEGTTYKGDATITGSVYGGSALGTVNAKKDDDWDKETNPDDLLAIDGKETKVNILKGTVNGSVFGGGLGDLATLGTGHTDIAAKVFGDVTVTVGVASSSAATTVPIIEGSVYGGSNVNGILEKAARLNVISGTIGTETTSGNNTVISGGNVHGGGFGQPTLVIGSVEVTIGERTGTSPNYAYSGYATIKGDVYGGSAMGNVNTADKTSATTDAVTNVNLYGCASVNNIYGGGLGDNTPDNEVAANVYGPVTVTVEGGKAGNVFGCNNKYGTPKSTVVVLVNGTDATDVNSESGAKTYALQGVYGGGNLAHYDPTTPGNYPTVTVNGCETSIKDVFGGGNAAAVPYTSVTINGGDIDRVFAGGNGTSGAANVGYKNSEETPTAGEDEYGTGTSNAIIAGGTINEIYGGSNNKGTVRATGTMSIAKSTAAGACPMKIGSVYGGGNQAPGAAVALTIGCTGTGDDEGITNVFGGANAANVTGNILLTITEGKIANVFGGNNSSGTVSGTITVNINKAASPCVWNIGNVFGGGKDAAYSTSNIPAGLTELDYDDNTAANYYQNFPVVNIKNGTVGNVFGGGQGSGATVTGNPQVTIGDATDGYEADVTGDVYGGGDAAAVVGTPAVHVINKDNTIIGNVYGGGNAADVSATSVTIDGGTIGMVFGGGHGDKNSDPQKAANVTGDVGVTVAGGTITKVFGGSNSKGNIGGAITLGIAKSTATGASDLKIGEVYGGGNEAAGNAGTITIGCTGTWTDSGEKNHTNANATDNRIGYELEGIGTVYGGANAANVGNDITLNITGGIVENVFGGNNTSGSIDGDITVNIEKGDATCSWYVGNVYGGGNLAAYSQKNAGHPAVNVKNGIVSGNVYGGGKGSTAVVTGNPVVTIGDATATHVAIVTGDVYGGGDAAAVTGNTTVTYNDNNTSSTVARLFGGGNAAGVSGTSTVTLTNGKVTTGVYGGCNSSGSVGDVTIALNGGQVGTDANTTADVYGGGLGQATKVDGNVTVNVGSKDYTGNTSVTIWGNVYGGGALGDVNTPKTSSDATVYTTLVNLFKGTVNGNVFGGGLGQAAKAAVGTEGQPGYQPAVPLVEPAVKGKVRVDLNGYNGIDINDANAFGSCIVTGNIFGCNNAKGSPENDVEVHIYKTVGTSPNVRSTTKDNSTFDLAAVYGGGNKATYSASGKTAKVIIETCEVSIKEVYGGGFGADVPNTQVDVRGAYEIGTVYGGGYGADTPGFSNPGANVNGSTEVLLKGGTIHEVYGGSNTKGNIVVGSNVNVSDGSGCCDLKVDNIYGGGKQASMEGGTSIVLGCQPNTWIEDIYAGSREADVDGNVSLTITSGKFERVFGGNKTSGKLKGSIKVNIEETGSCSTPIIIGELYAGGNQADYSIYGYNNDGTPRTKAQYDALSDTDKAKPENQIKANPQLNVRAFTSIGAIYGGGYSAKMMGDPTVSINVVKGSRANDPDLPAGTTPTLNLPYPAHASGAIGTIGNVFGGGNLAEVGGSATVNIGTKTTVSFITEPAHLGTGAYTTGTSIPKYTGVAVEGAYITGDVFGGGNQADVTGNTKVNICAIEGDDPATTDVTEDYHSVAPGTAGVTIEGTQPAGGFGRGVFGGGNQGNVGGDSYVYFGGGSVNQTIYGGGCEADVLGNTNVTMLDGYVEDGVCGGGLKGSVGNITEREALPSGHPTHTDCLGGKPKTFAENTGKCTVKITGGQVGPATVATEGMTRTAANGGPVSEGWVWGAGRGAVKGPEDDPDTDFRTYVYETDVTIGGTAFIMEGVVGGGEFGRVRHNTWVKIQDQCQIGVGEMSVTGTGTTADPYVAVKYDVAKFVDPATTTITSDKALKASSCFPYGRNTGTEQAPNWVYDTYDPYADEFAASNPYPGGSTDHASDGRTWIGCVFAGGSGYYPYKKNDNSGYDWLQSAGLVEGNAKLQISGGHILTNAYGGNEYTNVMGTCTVEMSGGTIGVPRTLEQIKANPMIGNLFGAGKGDPRVHFNKSTNVGEVEIEITGGIIYGSVFGGGEDGHVLKDVSLTIGKDDHTGPTIGSWGTSYFEGNVFGGGRGFTADAYTAGNVAGSVGLNIKGGNILGSVYGGGRLGSVGYGLFNKDENGYGTMRDDSDTEPGFNTSGDFTKGRGHIDITISGGNIGNKYEYGYIAPGTTIDDSYRSTNYIPFTEYDDNNQLKHTKGGNVFAGGMGRMYQMDGTTPISDVDWWKLGSVKSTKLTISGDAKIKSNVYGGGEMGLTVGQQKNGTVGTEVIINGGTIGTEIKDGETVKYLFGSVFGGGYGSLEEKLTHTGNKPASYPKYIAGRVKGGTKVNMSAGSVLASVYGGGEMAAVGESTGLSETPTAGLTGDTHVTISGGTIGKSGFGGAKIGNVYGGGSGHNNTVRSGHVYGNTNVTISNGTIYHNIYGGGAYGSVGDFVYETTDVSGAPKVSGITGRRTDHANTGVATVTITGGTIGVNGKENGMVFGSSRGDVNQPGERDDHTAWVYDANVTIGDANGGPAIKGSVYGSGENGHTFNDAVVTVNNGTIGISSGSDITYTENGQSVTKGGAAYPYRGNVYGGGCGTDKYYANHAEETHDGNGQLFNPLAGIVYGNATVNINGGTVVRNIYGAGAMGSVGKKNTDGTISGGTTTIAISGGTIGVSGTVGDGNVFGAARGDANATSNEFALVRKETGVSVTGGTVKGNVYGGGELGCVGTYVFTTDMKNFYWTNEKLETNKTTYTYNSTGECNVTISGGTIGTGVDPSSDGTYTNGNVFGAGKGQEDTWWCEKAIAYKSNVTITDGTINGTVYGGGQVGRVETDAIVKIGTENESGETSKPNIIGNVFGAGAGVMTHGYSALVRGNATVTVQGTAQVGGSVYGGGEIASVGRFTVVDGLPKHPDSGGTCTVTIQNHAKIGASGTEHNVFGACKGVTPAFVASGENRSKSMQLKANAPADANLWSPYNNDVNSPFIWRYYSDEAAYLDFLETLALTSHPIVTIAEDATVNGSVFGGGERGITLGSVEVNINGGTVAQDVYGGGSLANSNKGNWDTSTNTWTVGKTSATYTTTVNLMRGLIKGDAYGGGLGQLGTNPIEAKVFGDVNVTLDGTAFNVSYYDGAHSSVMKSGRVFGCNNLNGSPQGNVTVTVNKTVAGNKQRTTTANLKNANATHSYEVAAVYGGGNLADYTPVAANAKANVKIMTCDVSVKEVYGGGNAAAVPETDVLVNGAYEIETVFGGGNGKDPYTLDNGQNWIDNKGANIGLSTIGEHVYGNGNTNTLLKGGYIHEAYGGSNEKGTIKGTVKINAGTGGACTLDCKKIVAAGKNANLDGDAILVMSCVDGAKVEQVIGGADNANVNGNVELTITSGTFGKVFGGNNLGGIIKGHIKLNIEETNCTPIKIDELYLGGNEAAYSVYGYYNAGNDEAPVYKPRTSADDEHTAVENPATDATHTFPYADPELNIISCTYIGKVFGGGLGQGAVIYGNPTVNINMIPGEHADDVPDVMTAKGLTASDNPDKLGIIGDVYGGGNAADVIGNTTVNIGTAKTVTMTSVDDDSNTADIDEKHPQVKGAYIMGNVFGGGMGKDDTFTCEKAMVGKEDDGLKNPDGGTTVNIYNGKVLGNVYGGGEIGRVEKNTMVTIGQEGDETSAPEIRGYVFGGGKGLETHGYSALVRGNPTVTIQGSAKIGKSVYGGGEIASVGNFFVKGVTYPAELHAPEPPADIPDGMPYKLKVENSGKCTVIVRDKAEIGPDNMKMEKRDEQNNLLRPDDLGHVFGAGKGIMPYEATNDPKRMAPTSQWESYASNESGYITFIETLGMTASTDVTIGGEAFVKGSIYGGSENGHVLNNTKVTIAEKCQIGNGDGKNRRYTDSEWANEDPNDFAECASWPYGHDTGEKDANNKPIMKYLTYDVYDYVDPTAAKPVPKPASNGQTYYGNVFGGGSGIFPYKKKPSWSKDAAMSDVAGQPVDENGYSDGIWLRSAGAVYGNTEVNITGGHILTSVYGGNECTDVTGTSTVRMSGGTLGVPRTVEQMKAHPVTCYLFGAGKGDQRINFNTWTNIASVNVEITGGHIFGSVFGGGEDGHVLGDVTMSISGNDTKIGTTGTSYVDGNVFGGGRGFSGEAQTAGTVGGNITLNISSGTMLGSVYGGGRLASVGTSFTAPEDPNYGNFVEDAGGKTYGHVTINISGGTIGNGTGNSVIGDVSGNVFGGSMGRLTLLNGGTNPIWPKMAQVKSTEVNISGNALIKRTVYGGGELGTVRDNTHVTISGGQVNRDVYGGGYGSEDDDLHTIFNVKEPDGSNGYIDNTYAFTPMQFAGCVGKSTTVDVSGGYIRKSVYGGGEMASVGIMNCLVEEVTSEPGKDKIVVAKDNGKWTIYKNMRKHWDVDKEFALSWPIEFSYVPTFDGATHINITGGRIGTTTNDDYGTDNGDVYGGGKGFAGDYNDYVFCANVGSTDVNINYASAATTLDPAAYMSGGDCIAGAVYGGGENGHVMGDTHVTLTNGLIGHALYGGGSGKGQFTVKLKNIGAPASSTIESNPDDFHDATIYSILAGKVFGNTNVDMSGGYVVRNVYGGGTMGSVGKGNYAGGTDDYSTTGYGENAGGNLWTSSAPGDNACQFLNSGICTVNITGGTVGYTGTKDGLPYGNVFGGCRGEAAPNIVETPRYLYSPEFFVGYANETRVTIGAEGSTTGPRILGSVYGGGQDGHVRRDAKVTINSGEIGSTYTGDGTDLNNIEWLHSGNVYGAGSGIGKYQFDFNHDGDFDDVVDYNNGRSTVATKETDYSTSAGSVTRFTTVDIKGGTIHRNVYGGGSLSSIGAPNIGQDYLLYCKGDTESGHGEGKQTLNEVNISGGNIGDFESRAKDYGGHVFGGSRGDASLNSTTFSTSMFTKVNMGGGKVLGSIFGGGEVGIVKGSVAVNVTGGEVESDVYGGGALANTNTANPEGVTNQYTTTVNLLGGTINDAFGGGLGQKNGMNGATSDVEAIVYGDVNLNLNGLEPADYVPTIHSSLVTDVDASDETYYRATDGCIITGNVFGCNNYNGTPKGHAKVHVFKTKPRIGQASGEYDVSGVFGGGNAADYVPAETESNQSTEVIIEGCDLTSIDEVYGSGYGAASPATSVLVKGTKIINNLYGGGYGASTDTYTNPGANVGYLSDKTQYGQGTGKAIVQLMAGTINNVYGGSNTLGDIRGGSSVTNVANDGSAGCCEKLTVGEIYGGGKQADMYGGAEIVLGCMPNDWIGAIYAGAENADIGGDVGLTLTSGKFERVFGGNNKGGKIDGYIEVNIEENPDCETPIIIGELYGGGNMAPYTVPAKYTENNPNYLSPRVNVRAFTSIGNIYGGGLGANATVTGNPLVNINEVAGGREYAGETRTLEDGTKVTLYERKADGKMGVIGTVFGGGNAAPVIGNPRVEIGTAAKQKMLSLQTKDADGITIHEVEKDVLGADIRGNVYGGGNNAEVTGDPKVTIGQKKTE